MRKARRAPKKALNYVGKGVVMGKNVRLWHFCYVGDGTKLGSNVVIGSLAHLDRNVEIGDNTRVQGCVYIPPLTKIGKDVFIGPAAVLTNDPFPPSRRLGGTIIEDGAVIGAGAVIKAGARIGRNSVVGMGAVVVGDVPDNTVVIGIPAKPAYSRQTYDKKRREWERRAVG